MTEYCISKHTIKELDKYIIFQNINLLKKIANDYKINENDFIKEILTEYIDNKLLDKELNVDDKKKNNKINKPKRCMSRIWNGEQCTKFCSLTNDENLKDYCIMHQQSLSTYGYLRYGRIDEISKFRMSKKPNEPYLRCIYKISNDKQCTRNCCYNTDNKLKDYCKIHQKIIMKQQEEQKYEKSNKELKKHIKKRCMSRTHTGEQCIHNCAYTNNIKLKDYCQIHQQIIISHKELIYGRIDEDFKLKNNIQKRCMSKIWNGEQCSKKCGPSSNERLKDYCKMHQQLLLTYGKLKYGRINS